MAWLFVCNIFQITNHTFFNLNKLEELYLLNNYIADIQFNSLGELSSLKILDLSYNYLKVISKGLFDGLNKLTNLYLKNNRIEIIESFSISNLASLDKIDLDYNVVKKVESELDELDDDEDNSD